MVRSRSPHRLVAFLAAVALSVTGCVSGGSSTTSHGLDVEDNGVRDLEIAPLFSVPTADGGTFSLDQHLASDGRPVFLNLWASWCFPCRQEMPAIDTASLTHTDVAFVGVSVQDIRSDAEAFLDEIGVSYTIGFDDEAEVDGEYRPLGLPASYIISSEGVILERIFGEVTEESLAEKFENHFG